MHKKEFAIGQALAYLKQDNSSRAAGVTLNIPETQQSTIDMLQKRLSEIRSNEGSVRRLKINIPENQCDSDSLFIKNNQDIFLVLFFDQHGERYCEQFSLHLNNCFRCFEYFSDVIRAYYHETNQMRKQQ